MSETYFTPTGPLMSLLKVQIRTSQTVEPNALFLRELAQGVESRWTTPGTSEKEMRKALVKLWEKTVEGDAKDGRNGRGDRTKAVGMQMGKQLQIFANQIEMEFPGHDHQVRLALASLSVALEERGVS
jgi:hypothetical protein